MERDSLMKKRLLVAVLVLGVSLAVMSIGAACGGSSDDSDVSTDGQKTEQANPPKSDPELNDFREIAVESCVDEASGQGVTEDMAEGYCGCAIDKFMGAMDKNELKDIALKAGTEGEIPEEAMGEMENAVLDCLNELLTE
jgi:hypothetical protein